MIEGDAGIFVLNKVVELREDVDGDTISATLLAAVYADALRKGASPRTVIDDLWKALPEDDAWRDRLEEQLREAVDLKEAA